MFDEMTGLEVEKQPRFGGGPSPLRNEKTLKNALSMLTKGERCEDVALASGYSSLSAFTAAFKLVTGENPSEFKTRVGAPPVKRIGKPHRGARARIKHPKGAKPLPRYDAKKKPKTRKTRKKSRTAAKKNSRRRARKT